MEKKQDQLNRLELNLGGNDYVLYSKRTAEEMQRIVSYVTAKLREAPTANRRLNRTMQATLTAFNIADELFAEREALKMLMEEAREPMSNYEPTKERLAALEIENDTHLAQIEALAAQRETYKSEAETLAKRVSSLERELNQQRQSSKDKDEDVKALQINLDKAEAKLIDLAQQFQAYRRTHR